MDQSHTASILTLGIGSWSKVEFPSEHVDWTRNLLVPPFRLELFSNPPIHLSQNVHEVLLLCKLKHCVDQGLDKP